MRSRKPAMSDEKFTATQGWFAILLLAMNLAVVILMAVLAASRDAAALAYQTQQGDANSRIHVLELEVKHLQRDLIKDKFPGADPELLTLIEEWHHAKGIEKHQLAEADP